MALPLPRKRLSSVRINRIASCLSVVGLSAAGGLALAAPALAQQTLNNAKVQPRSGDTQQVLSLLSGAGLISSPGAVPLDAPLPPSIADLRKSAPHSIGLILCDPVPAADVSADQADFAAGCGDYLEVQVAGMPEFGQSPLITSVWRAIRELKLPYGLRLSVADAERVARITGASDFVAGTVSSSQSGGGGAATLRITYRRYRLSGAGEARPLGAPLIFAGSPDRLTETLPGFAATVARAFGASRVPAAGRPSLSRGELSALGRGMWHADISPADVKAIEAAAMNDPTAMISRLTMEHGRAGSKPNDDTALLLTKLAPKNGLAWAHAAYTNAASVIPLKGRLAELRKSYPGNYPLAQADVWANRVAGNAKQERLAAEDIVRNAPRNPDAWLSLALTLSAEGQAVRRSRVAKDLSRAEWTYLRQVYPAWFEANMTAVTLDPKHEVGWTRLIYSATFANQMTTADDAYEKAEQFSLNKPEVYRAGLEMFQAKWRHDSGPLETVAMHASTADYTRAEDATSVAAALKRAGFTDKANAVLERFRSRIDARIKADPKDAHAHWQMASVLWHENKMPDSCREYKTVTLLLPNNADAHYDYAKALDAVGASATAVTEYKTVLKLDPEHVWAPLYLAIALERGGQNAEAEKSYRAALQRMPNSKEVHYAFATLYVREKRYVEAAAEFKHAMDLGFVDPKTYAYRTMSLNHTKNYTEAIRVGEEGLRRYGTGESKPADATARMIASLHSEIAYAYLKTRRYAEAEQHNDAATALNPLTSMPVVNQGYVYKEEGHRAKARKQWQTAATMKLTPTEADEVRHDLATNPENGT